MNLIHFFNRRKTLLLLPFCLLLTVQSSVPPRPLAAITADQALTIAIAPPLTEEERREDAEYLVKVLTENYPLFGVNQRKNGTDWLANREFYVQKMTEAENDAEFLKALNRTLGDLHDGHTHVVDPGFLEMLHRSYEGSTVEDPWYAEMSRKSVFRRYPMDGRLLLLAPVYDQSLFFSDDLENYDGIDTAGYVYTAYDYEAQTVYWPEHHTAYVRIPTFDGEQMQIDGPKIVQFLQTLESDTSVILDIRGNGGGYETFWRHELIPMLTGSTLAQDTYMLYRNGDFQQPFMRSLTPYKKAKVGKDIEVLLKKNLPNLPSEAAVDFERFFRHFSYISPDPDFRLEGQTFLLVDQGVYSAAETFASFAKESGFATLIGTTTGGGGIGTGPILCALPHSGYLIRFPHEMGITADGTSNDEFGTKPHIELDAPYLEEVNPLQDKAVIRALELDNR